MHAIRRIFPKIVWGEEIPIETISQISVKSDDFNLALSEIKPSALREVFVEIPMITWDQVGGLDDVKQELKEIVEWPSKYPALFDYMNTVVPRGILLSERFRDYV
jgi:transitional endoplasmic reticulum ATPase